MALRTFFLLLAFCAALATAAQQDTVPPADTPRRGTSPRQVPPRPRAAPPQAAVLGDTARRVDSAGMPVDSLALLPAVDSNYVPPPTVVALRFDSLVAKGRAVFRFQNPVRRMESVRVRTDGKEYLFYSVAGLLLFFALFRNGFGRYLQDLFRLFFRSSLKQRQAKEQLMEAYLPSLLLNLLFVGSGALFLSLVLRSGGLGRQFSYWQLLGYSAAGLAAIYLVKFLALKLCGWIFRVAEATDTYTFIVFTTNKVLGIALLPFIVLLAFTTGTFYQVAFTLSLLVAGGLWVYRYVLSYSSVQRQVRLGLLHFAIYLCAFEILPLLLINKLLFRFLG